MWGGFEELARNCAGDYKRARGRQSENADEWQYHRNGQARMTIVGASQCARTLDFQVGDVG